MPTKRTAIQIGTTFRSLVADANPIFKVIKKVAPGVYEAAVVNEQFTVDGQTFDSDYSGLVKVFKAEEIDQAVRRAKFFESHASANERFYAGLTIGQVLHYSNGFNQFVRCQVVVAETPHSEGKKVKALKPIALVGEWRKHDLPSRDPDGSIYNPCHVESIRKGEAFQPNVGCVFESHGFQSRTGGVDPTKADPIDLTVPPMTAEEEKKAALWRVVHEVQNQLNGPDGGSDPAALLARVRVMVDAALGGDLIQELVADAIAHLGAALSQSIPSDDEMIMGHVRSAKAHLEVAWKTARRSR